MTDGETEDGSPRRGSAADAAEPVPEDRTAHESEDVEPERSSSSGGPNWVRILVASAAVVTLLLLGAAAGMLIGLPGAANRAAPPEGSVDVGFAQDMSVHHRQATQMATLYRANGTQGDIRTLAFDIDTNQRAQIGWMQGWLNLWDRPLNPLDGYMAWMSEGGGHGHGGGADSGASPEEIMPGMASQEELQQLRSLRGSELDVYFLQLMLRHHEGGAEMAGYAAERAAIPQVRNLASNMLHHQAAETRKMTGMLADLGAEPLPFEG